LANSIEILNGGDTTIVVSDSPLFPSRVTSSGSIAFAPFVVSGVSSIFGQIASSGGATLPSILSSGLSTVSEQVSSFGAVTLPVFTVTSIFSVGNTFITVETSSYTEGSGGSGPSLTITASQSGTSPNYTLFGATHLNGTTLSKSDIENGIGTEDTFSITASTIDALDASDIGLTASITNGHLSFFIRDANGVESLVTKVDSVNVDATAPTISSVTTSNIASSSVDWSTITDEAGGTIYVGARPSGSAALTAEQLIAGSGGAGVSFDSDTPAVSG